MAGGRCSMRSSCRGFTLIELMFGVFVLIIGLAGVQQGLISCLFLNVQNSHLTVAANDAQYVMEQIKSLDYDTCIATNFSQGCYTFPVFYNLPHETVVCTNVPSGANRRQITITIRWMERERHREYSLATYFTS